MSSPFSTGGGGFTFEDGVVASYLVSLLSEGGIRGLQEATATQVRVQRGSLGEPMDDVIVSGIDRYDRELTLSLQVKHHAVLSAAPTNESFREVVAKGLAQIGLPSFKIGRDRVGLACSNISQTSLNAARDVCEWARNSADAVDFHQRLSVEGFSNNPMRKFETSIRALVSDQNEVEETTWNFLRHFVVLQFDFLPEGAGGTYVGVELLRETLSDDERHRAGDLFTNLRLLARQAAGEAGSFSKGSLREQLASKFDLRIAPSFRMPLRKIADASGLALGRIHDKIGGVHVARQELRDKILKEHSAKRFVLLIGEPGTGKSCELKWLALQHLSDGHAMVLTESRAFSDGWNAMAARLSIDSFDRAELMIALQHAGQPALFIDGLDRLSNGVYETVTDIISTIMTDPRLSDWRVVATSRSSGLEDVRIRLPESLLDPINLSVIEVDALNDKEALYLAERVPRLRTLLFQEGAARRIARRPFFANVLSRLDIDGSSAEGDLSEIALADVWLGAKGDIQTVSKTHSRRTALGRLAEDCSAAIGRATPATDLEPDQLALLIDEGILAATENAHRYRFTHDIFHEWSLYGACRQSGNDWPDVIDRAGDRPSLLRVVELLSMAAFETGETWETKLNSLEESASHSHWTRAWLMGPFSTPISASGRAQLAKELTPKRQKRLMAGFRAHKTIENLWIIEGRLEIVVDDRLERQRLADQMPWPRPLSSWQRLLSWLLTLEWDEMVLEDILETFDVWLNLFQETSDTLRRQYAERLDSWLKSYDSYQYPYDRSQSRPLGYGKRDFGTKLRNAFIRAAIKEPDILRRRLANWSGARIAEEVQGDVIRWSTRLSTEVPDGLVDFALAAFSDDLPSEAAAQNRGHVIGWSPSMSDYESPGVQHYSHVCEPASPIQEPFAALFKHAPEEALRLVRALLSRASAGWRELHQYGNGHSAKPLPITIAFPWGTQTFWGDDQVYVWHRGVFAGSILSSALMSLEAWAFSELESGRELEAIVRDLVTGHDSVSTIGIAVALCITELKVSPVALSLLGCQHLWRMEDRRWREDQSLHHANEIGFVYKESTSSEHAEALRKANGMEARKRHLSNLATLYALKSEDTRSALETTLSKFAIELPFYNEAERNNEEVAEKLSVRAAGYARLADLSSYEGVRTEHGEIGVQLKPDPERLPEAKAAEDRLSYWGEGLRLLKWAKDCLEAEALVGEPVSEIIDLAEKIDKPSLFKDVSSGNPAVFRAGGVASVAAVVMKFALDSEPELVDWATLILRRAAETSEKTDPLFHPDQSADDRPEIFAAIGLSASVKRGTASSADRERLLGLFVHPLRGVQATALSVAASCWREDLSLADAAIFLALSEVTIEPDRGTSAWHKKRDQRAKTLSRSKLATLKAVLKNVRKGNSPEWSRSFSSLSVKMIDEWRIKHFVRFVELVPADRFGEDQLFRRTIIELLSRITSLLSAAMASTLEKGARENGVRNLHLASCMWKLSELSTDLSSEQIISDILPAFVCLPAEARSENLSRFADALSCRFLLDPIDPKPGVVKVLIAIFDLTSDDPDWDRAGWTEQRGLSNSLSLLLRVAMGTNCIRLAPKATRFANNDWTDAAILDPLIDWMLERHGNISQVVFAFLDHLERSLSERSATYLASRLAMFPELIWTSQAIWGGGTSARLSNILRAYTEETSSLDAATREQFVVFLNHLSGVGDRRAVSLLRSSYFDRPRRTGA